MKLARLPVAVCAAALFAYPVLAQQTSPATTPQAGQNTPAATPSTATPAAPSSTAAQGAVTFKNQQMQNEIMASRLMGTTVRNNNGEDLGDINDLAFDPQTKSAVAIIGVGGFLGIGEKNVGVPFEQLQVTRNNDGNRVVQLNVTKDALNAAPQYVMLDRGATTTGTGTGTQRTQ